MSLNLPPSALDAFRNLSPDELAQRYSDEELAELEALLEQEEAERIDALCSEKIISHKRGPMFWLRNYTATENKQWQAQGLKAVAPFPLKPHNVEIDLDALPFPNDFKDTGEKPDYLDIVCGYLLTEDELWIPKTREMMTSWLVVGFITWHCQFHDSIEWVGQSEDDSKAMGLIEYSNTLYKNQPEWLKRLHPLKSRKDEGTQHEIEWSNGSRFIGVPSGTRKLASKHPHGYFSDESAHQAAFEATLNIAKPAVRQVVCVSSVAPGAFWDQVQAAI